jgi:hypothetical protein
MPRKPTKRDDPEQSKRFIETAEQVGADTDAEALERALKKVVIRKSPDSRHTGTKTKTTHKGR